MQIILLERVPKLGQMGEVVTVKPGFARNFLIPRGKALRATKARSTTSRSDGPSLRRATSSASRRPRRAAKVDGQSVAMLRQASETSPALRLGQRARHRRRLRRGRHHARPAAGPARPAAEDLGSARGPVALHPEVEVTVKVNIARSQAEADLQAGKPPPAPEPEEEERELSGGRARRAI